MTLDPLVVFAAIGTILGAVVTTGLRGDWVWGRELKAERASSAERLAEERTEKLFWRSRALKATDQADKAIDLAAVVVTKPSDG